MNHSNSWLLEGISCPALSLSLCLTPLLKAGQEPGLSFDLDPEGEREESLAQRRALALGLLWEGDMETRSVLGDACTPKQGFSALSFYCNMSSRTYSNCNLVPNAKSALRERSLLGVESTFSRRQMFVISVLRPLNMEHHCRGWELHSMNCSLFAYCQDLMIILNAEVNRRAVCNNVHNMLALQSCTTFPLEAKSTRYVQLGKPNTTKVTL